MNNTTTIQTYINDFRRHLSRYLKPNIGLACKAYPAQGSGAILEFTIRRGIANDDKFMVVEPTVNDALGKIRQHAFGGDLRGFVFAGTNVVMEKDRIILIKGGNDESEWNDEGAQSDVKKILPASAGGAK
jgi:hypothetical protein